MNVAIYIPLAESMIIAIGFAYSQSIVLKAGMFALSPAGFGLIGGYSSAYVVMRWGWPPASGMVVAAVLGGFAGFILSLPLSRLRGAFQAIATLAFVQIAVSLAFYAENLTGGALGLNGIPRSVGLGSLLVFLAILVTFVTILSRTGIGRAFDAIRQDETVAVSLGIPVARFHTLALTISGAIASLTGCLLAFSTYSISPEEFGFSMLVTALAAVVLGGRLSIAGPAVGVVILSSIPELFRPLTEHRLVMEGALLVLVMVFMPSGIVDTLLAARRPSLPEAVASPEVLA